jgi:hypothetical protein
MLILSTEYASLERDGATPVGVDFGLRLGTQGSSLLATLGWRAQSLWDWGCGEGTASKRLTIFGFAFSNQSQEESRSNISAPLTRRDCNPKACTAEAKEVHKEE